MAVRIARVFVPGGGMSDEFDCSAGQVIALQFPPTASLTGFGFQAYDQNIGAWKFWMLNDGVTAGALLGVTNNNGLAVLKGNNKPAHARLRLASLSIDSDMVMTVIMQINEYQKK